jgi:hypothetical protein
MLWSTLSVFSHSNGSERRCETTEMGHQASDIPMLRLVYGVLGPASGGRLRRCTSRSPFGGTTLSPSSFKARCRSRCRRPSPSRCRDESESRAQGREAEQECGDASPLSPRRAAPGAPRCAPQEAGCRAHHGPRRHHADRRSAGRRPGSRPLLMEST